MSTIATTIEAPLTPEQLARRWQALCADPTFEDVAGKIELTEWGEILMSPLGKSHGIAAMRVAEGLRRSLGGRSMAEVGVATSIGVYVNAGAIEAWIVFPQSRQIEIYGREGRKEATSFILDMAALFS